MSGLSENYNYVISAIGGYEFKNKDLLYQAFTRRSYSQEYGGENNEILEFIGDRVLDYYVTKILMDRFGYFANDCDDYRQGDYNDFIVEKYNNEGKLSNLKKKFVNKKMLASRIEKLGFNEFLFMGKGDVKNQRQYEDSVMEDLFEAILGAIAIDSEWDPVDLETAVSMMLNIDYYLENGFNNDDDDYVTLIQDWSLKENGHLPIYEYNVRRYAMLTYYGSSNDNTYTATLSLETQYGLKYFEKAGTTKSEARWNAAKAAYDYLDENDLLWTIIDELPDDLTTDNSINTLQELAQKGYISYPVYEIDDYLTNGFEDGLPRWGCTVRVESNRLIKKGYSTSKKAAKKYVAYLAICEICDIEPDE